MELVPLNQIHTCFYSIVCMVPNRIEKMKPVINLRSLRRYLRKKTHFKMDTLSKGLHLIKSKDWTTILDLSDA